MLTSIEIQESWLISARRVSDFRQLKIVITGFNTDIEHDGVVYHVQTEDKGLESPLLLSLVYVGGAILAAKRSRYEDLIASGFNEEVLSQRLKRQHNLICAAIKAGRIADLKGMSSKTGPDAILGATETVPEAAAAKTSPRDTAPLHEGLATLLPEEPAAQEPAFAGYQPQGGFEGADNGLWLAILNDEEFRAGEPFDIRILLGARSGKKEKALASVPLSVKILGTAFRPQIYSVKTERDGAAVVSAVMPTFTSGRAAVLVRAVVKGETIEVRRVIYPAD